MDAKKHRPQSPRKSPEPGESWGELWDQMVLKDQLTTGRGYVSAKPQDDLVGKTGKTITDLRPAGTAWIEGRPVDVVSEGVFLEKGKTVRVLEVQGMRVVVRWEPEA